MSEMITLMDRLRTETASCHDRMSTLPLFEAVLNEAITPEAYVGLLRVLGIVHAVLERHLALVDDPAVALVYDPRMDKLDWILQDLACVGRIEQPGSAQGIQ